VYGNSYASHDYDWNCPSSVSHFFVFVIMIKADKSGEGLLLLLLHLMQKQSACHGVSSQVS
jgi:hypothetical protein